MSRSNVSLSIQAAFLSLLLLSSEQCFSIAVFTIQRVDDYTATITGVGGINPGTAGNYNSIHFADTFSVEPTVSIYQDILDTSTMLIGGTEVDGATAYGGASYLSDGVYGVRLFNYALEELLYSPITGSITLTIQPEFHWADIGSSGYVYSGIGAQGQPTGTWNMVASSPLPIPPALWLFGSGLIGLVGMARRT